MNGLCRPLALEVEFNALVTSVTYSIMAAPHSTVKFWKPGNIHSLSNTSAMFYLLCSIDASCADNECVCARARARAAAEAQ